MKKWNFRSPEFLISAAGLLALGAGFALWLRSTGCGVWGKCAAGASAVLFAALGLRFVPVWMRFWRRDGETALSPAPQREARTAAGVFFALLGFDLLVLLAVWALRNLTGHGCTFAQSLEFWRCLDSQHYLDIARDWYLSEGEWDRLVQLVFLPGYPLAIRLLHLLVPNWLYAALLVSALSFAGGGTVLYRLLRLDFSRETALRALALLCLLPGSFFFAAPMSESLFFLLCVSCLYLARTRRWLAACICGGLAAFTRSLGLTLLAPLVLELTAAAVRCPAERRRTLPRAAALLLIPAGFGAYCYINYRVAGNSFQYMTYQRVHWGQQLGWFFNTAAYQTENLLRCAGTDPAKFWGLWLPNLLASFGALGVFCAAARRLRPSYTAWAIGYFFVAVGVTWLLSAPRYLLTFFPLSAALAALTEGRPRAAALTAACSAALAFCYLLAFVLRWQVW